MHLHCFSKTQNPVTLSNYSDKSDLKITLHQSDGNFADISYNHSLQTYNYRSSTLPEVGDLVLQKLPHAILDLEEFVPLHTQNCPNTVRPVQ